ncbi:nicotinate (nicotinamide) nucleotide adenylyltransferase [Aliifodinibius sp. S!AR15-10]|uniref:nicotinate (nicotinamide) nucleotide adenylyltransferase n=1 Tax=Aliifodinibius sp. S!AR15-10 TaxID=2950437 RepID=UPI00285DDC98|nr:nicotinate (nicotinamide) nucleotide adenylyltransferase [Aliifodinibius sp. S!AR15-10]MDR8391574.1 nicotinate (nicotinamide) nucleotide adenylyltransferase [Aliifodinibius sp. S!AR15-10]
MSTRVGIFGGTFDPVHNGHISIVRSFIKSGLIDEMWILPSPSPPHKTDKEITSFDHRKKMLELVFSNDENIKISDIEEKLPLPSYTIHTLQYLKQKYPDNKFYLCIGGDSLADFKNWYRAEKIAGQTDLLVAERPEADGRDVSEKFLQNTQFVEHTPVNISATEVRKELQKNGEGLQDQVPPEVLQYIRDNGLYKN